MSVDARAPERALRGFRARLPLARRHTGTIDADITFGAILIALARVPALPLHTRAAFGAIRVELAGAAVAEHAAKAVQGQGAKAHNERAA